MWVWKPTSESCNGFTIPLNDPFGEVMLLILTTVGSVGLKVLVLRGEILPHSKRTTQLKAMAAVDQPTKKGVAIRLGLVNPEHRKELVYLALISSARVSLSFLIPSLNYK